MNEDMLQTSFKEVRQTNKKEATFTIHLILLFVIFSPEKPKKSTLSDKNTSTLPHTYVVNEYLTACSAP